jgi:hypothetical protein
MPGTKSPPWNAAVAETVPAGRAPPARTVPETGTPNKPQLPTGKPADNLQSAQKPKGGVASPVPLNPSPLRQSGIERGEGGGETANRREAKTPSPKKRGSDEPVEELHGGIRGRRDQITSEEAAALRCNNLERLPMGDLTHVPSQQQLPTSPRQHPTTPTEDLMGDDMDADEMLCLQEEAAWNMGMVDVMTERVMTMAMDHGDDRKHAK